DIYLLNLTVLMFSKCSSVEDARIVFQGIQHPNTYSWNIMLGAYAQNGHLDQARWTLESMPEKTIGVKPDEATFHSGIVGCNHAGMVRECCKCFKLMSLEHGISPQKEHFCVVVDVLCKSGQLNHAQDLLQNMPFVPDSAV
ncbi:hypothetical protein SELMODRAFT_72345, partial [Selaginella moellendorffii]